MHVQQCALLCKGTRRAPLTHSSCEKSRAWTCKNSTRGSGFAVGSRHTHKSHTNVSSMAMLVAVAPGHSWSAHMSCAHMNALKCSSASYSTRDGSNMSCAPLDDLRERERWVRFSVLNARGTARASPRQTGLLQAAIELASALDRKGAAARKSILRSLLSVVVCVCVICSLTLRASRADDQDHNDHDGYVTAI